MHKRNADGTFQGYVVSAIRKSALSKIVTFDTLYTFISIVLAALIGTSVFPNLREGVPLFLPAIIFVLGLAAAVYGLTQFLPALAYLIHPYWHPLFHGRKGTEEKVDYCRQIEDDLDRNLRFEYDDALGTNKLLILEGYRCFDVLPFDEISRFFQVRFAGRSKGGIHYFVFIDRDERRHTFDLHTGKGFHPVHQATQIVDLMAGFAPEVRYCETRKEALSKKRDR